MLRIFQQILNLLPRHRAGQFWMLFAGMVCTALFETTTLGAIAFFASSIADPDVVLHSKYTDMLNRYWGSPIIAGSRQLVLYTSISVIFLVSIKNLFRGLMTYWTTRFSGAVEAIWGNMLLKGFLNLPYIWHMDQNTADLIYAVEWRKIVGRNFILRWMNVLSDAILVVIMFASFIVIQPVVSLVTIGIVGSSAYLIYFGIKKMLDRSAIQCREYEKNINKKATIILQGIKDVKIAGKEDRFLGDISTYLLRLSRFFGKQEFLNKLPNLMLETIGFVVLAGSICILVLWMNISMATLTGTVALLAVTAWKALPAVNRVLSGVAAIRNNVPYLNKLFQYVEVFEEKNITYIGRDTISRPPVSFEREIMFSNVVFQYPRQNLNILDDLTFKIRKGQTLGIIGPSGSGKSTLANLLIGLLEPSGGDILIDGASLSSLSGHSWLGSLGYVSQSPYIFDGTLAENVAFDLAQDEINRQKVLDCCLMASMGDFLHTLENGIDTMVGERGVRLSGGQQQRLVIARALYGDPALIVFDEATSSLDHKSEKEVQQTIYNLQGKLTLIIIAHRLSTVENCDVLLWIENGEIRMNGRPDEVLEAYAPSH